MTAHVPARTLVSGIPDFFIQNLVFFFLFSEDRTIFHWPNC